MVLMYVILLMSFIFCDFMLDKENNEELDFYLLVMFCDVLSDIFHLQRSVLYNWSFRMEISLRLMALYLQLFLCFTFNTSMFIYLGL